jgi:3-deoxy-D-manno-octulosonic acid (KDO) 8-phosphate synthase
MSKAALAVGADGLLIEVHARPDEALSDGHQALTPARFAKLMTELRQLAPSFGKQLAAASREAPRRGAADTRSFDDKVIAP